MLLHYYRKLHALLRSVSWVSMPGDGDVSSWAKVHVGVTGKTNVKELVLLSIAMSLFPVSLALTPRISHSSLSHPLLLCHKIFLLRQPYRPMVGESNSSLSSLRTALSLRLSSDEHVFRCERRPLSPLCWHEVPCSLISRVLLRKDFLSLRWCRF